MNNKPARELSLTITAIFLSALFVSALFVSACATDMDTVENRRGGQVMVCHKGSKTLTVSNADSFGHLDHGDTAGPCPEEGSD